MDQEEEDLEHAEGHRHGHDHADDWRAWRINHDQNARERLIETYLPFARMLAAKLYGRRTYPELEFQDYFQHATIGLIESIDRYDPERGIRFEPYASARIRGAILSGIETLSEKQEQVSARKRILEDRTSSLKGDATGQSTEALFETLAEIAIGLATGVMLEGAGIYQDRELSYMDNAYLGVELKQLRERVLDAVSFLSASEKKVITYHYLQHFAFEEIARTLGVSKGRVSQIHKAALKRLREILARDAINVFF